MNFGLLIAIFIAFTATISCGGAGTSPQSSLDGTYALTPSSQPVPAPPANIAPSKGLEAAFLKRLPNLVSSSTRIVTGRVKGISSFSTVNAKGDEFVLSDVTVTVDEEIKGDSPREVVIRTLGGSLNGLRYIYSFAPDLAVGQKTLLFLSERGNIIYPSQFKWGQYTLTDENLIKNTQLTLDAVKGLIKDHLK